MAIHTFASANGVTKQTGSLYTFSDQKNNIQLLNSQSKAASNEAAEAQNNGGFLGGVGYLFEKVGLGFLSGIEGIWDYGAGGIAKLFGADDWAEQQFSNDWVNYSHADEWFNPSEGWQVAGDVAGGIGTSLPAIAGVAAGAAIAYFSGGSLSPLAAGIISGSIAGFGAAGNATKEAYKQSGELGAKEFGYGFLSGATEAGVEILTAGMAKGSGRIVSSIAKATAKETAETVAKTGAKTVIKNLVTDFATEAFEEGLAEVLDPVYQRMTFNPDAENATPQEVAYAALVGGLSGLVMSGGSTAISAGVNTTQNLFSGSKAIENGTVESVMETARQLTETENANDTGYASFQTVKNAYEQLSESLKTTGGTVQTVKQKMLLGQIKRANTASIFMPFIERSAVNILANAESVAQRYSEFGMKDANGKPLNLTADDIRSGVDATLLQIAPQERTREQQKALVKSIRAALTSNSTLATLAVADATGRITMDTQRFAEAALNGANLANSADLNYFVEHASKEQIAALSADLGISDWSALTIDDFRARVAEFATSEKISEYAQQSKRIRAAMQTAQESAKPIPHILRRNMSDGVYRFTSENSAVNMAVFKEGETYHLFDYQSGNISRSLSVQEVNKVLRTFWNSNTVQTPTVEQAFSTEANLGQQTLDIDAMARKQIPEYHTLSEPNKQAVRMTIRQAQAHGIAEAETLTFARVAARSGMNVVFDGAKSAVGDANIQGNTIYINPDAPKERLQSRLLLHEAGHALLRGKDGKNLITEAFKHIAPERSQEIAQRYINFYKKQGMSMEQYMPIVNEEITTAYIEDVLGDANAWEYILGEDPSLSEKVLSFFRKAAKEYSADEKLSAEARKLLRTYKKLFADLSAQNQGNNALELTRQDEQKKKAVTRTNDENVQVTETENTRLSIKDGKVIIDTDRGIFDGVDRKDYGKTVRTYMRTHFRGKRVSDTVFTKISEREYTASKYTQGIYSSEDGIYEAKMQASTELDKIVSAGKFIGHEDAKHPHNHNGNGYDRFEVIFNLDGEDFRGEMLIAIDKDDRRTFYDIVNIKRSATDRAADIADHDGSASVEKQHISQPTNAEALIRTPEARSSMDTVPTDSITDPAENVNRNSEISSDERHALPDEDVSEERIAAIRAELDEIRVQEREAKERKDALEDKERAQSYIEAATKDGITGEEIARLAEEYNRWADEIGYAAASKAYEELTERHRKLYAEQQRIEEKLSKQLLTREYTPEEVSKYVSKAVRRFRTTTRLNCAAYLLTTGSMLDFSEGQGYRVQDHREIADILDLPDYAQYSDGMIIFMNMGNIRLQTYGIDISAMPNSKQISALRGIIQRVMSEYDEFIVDFSTKNGYSDGSITYPKNIASSRIIFDIQTYFETGKLPEEPSSLSDFRYALPETNSDGEALTEQQKEYFKDSRTKDGQGRLLVLYHQTNAEFTEFDTQREGAGARDNETPHGIFLKPTDENIGLKGDKQMRLYANITNPLKFYTRADAQWYWKHNIDGYADILAQIAVNDRVYNEQFEEAFDLKRLARRRRNTELSEMERKEIDALYEESEAESQKVLDEWKDANTALDKKAKALIDEYLKDNGYDGVFLLEDQGSFGRKVQTYIALSAEQVKNTDNAAPTASKDVRYALPDEEYLAAVEAGDTDAAQAMVDQAAKEAGYTIKSYHGTLAKDFTEFKKSFIGSRFNYDDKGFFFIDRKSIAEDYATSAYDRNMKGRVLEVYLRVKKPLIVDKAFCLREGLGNPFRDDDAIGVWDAYLEFFKDEAAARKADGIILDDGMSKMTVVFDGEQIKSADPITYDNAGNVIPISKRFKPYNRDMRYALPETDSEGNTLSAGQREYFADSKVLDENGNLMVMYHGTPNGAHNTFRSGSYFTPDASYADKYQNPSASSLSTGKTASNPKTYKVYLNITKPFDTRNDAERDIFQNEYYRKYGTGAPLSESGLPDWTDGMDLQEFIEEMGYDYDGLILDEGGTGGYGDEVISRGLSYVTFSSEQVKNVDNKNPTTDKDIRHALPDEDLDALFDDDADGSNSAQDATFDAEAVVARGMPRTAGKSSLTVGELRKIIANNTKQKVYSKQDALSVVGRFAGISDLTQKTRTEIADAVWQILNESPDVEYRRDVAHDMAEFIVAKIIVDAKTENPDALEAQERLSYLRTGIGKLSFSEEDMSEIRHVRDKKGLKQVLGRWGYKGAHKVAGASGVVSSKRTPMDVFVVDIAREMPAMEYLEEMHPVDAFLEIDSLYERALAESKDKWISAYWDMPDSEIPSMIKSVEDEIMRAYETEGEQSKFSRMVENKIGYYSERAEYWKAEYDKIKGRDRLLGLLMSKAQKMKDLKLGTFANSTQHDSEIFKNSIEQLARIQFRGNLNVSGTRKILADLRQWYTSDAVKTGILEYVDANSTGLYVQGVADMLEILSEGKKGFTKDDLKMLYDVMSYFTNFVENWGKVFRQGKWIEAKPEAERYINTLHANESLKVGLFSKLAGTTYMQTFGDPMTVARRMDMYESGFYTEMMQELRDAAVDAQVAEMEIRAAYDEFTKKHKKYVEKASVDTVSYRGTEIPKMHLIGLYMTMKRKHAWAGLAANGFAFTDTKGKRVRVNGVVSPEAKITNAELEQYTKEQLSAIEALLTDTDKEYITILEQAFNVDARKLKADRDMQRLGFTNATNDYYYPIRRGNIAKNVDTADIAGELDRVSNSSFNKDTVRGAKQELFIESADAVFNRHIHAVCQYAYLSPAVEAYNRLYNLDISGNKNKPISVATESANTWDKGNKYFVKLISDIQGIPATSSEGMKALGFIRGSYAKFQLGANPKVWFTQLSSIFASSSLLDADSITRGMAVSSKGMDEYCSLAKLRNNDNTAAMAQGVLDSKAKRAVGAVSKFSDLLMSPIGKMDRFVVGRLFGACQVQVQKNGGAKIGTEANKVEAGKLLRRVILETQQNAVATERSAAMRSGNEIMRTLTMFTSDSMKVVGRVIDAIGEVATLKSKLKATTDADTRSALKQQLKAANRKARKAVGALCLTAVFMASIAQLFRWLYDKEQDEDESVAETMLVDAVGNLFGGLPLFKDAYAKIFEGYDVDNYAYSAVNDLLDSALNLFEVAGNILTNEGSVQDRNRAVRNLAYSVGQMFGIPVRNVYNVFFGLTKRFNPEAAYMIDSALYEKNYQNELYKAIEQDDAEMTSFIMSLLLGERMNENVDEAVFNELLILSKNGQKVIPRSVPSSITIDEVEYPLSAAEQAAIKDIYATSEKSLKALFAKSKYNTLSDEQKAAAIDFIYDTYYDKALEGALGIDRGNNSLIIADVVGLDNLALLYVTTKGLTSDIDRRGNVISGSKRKKVVAAINSLGVSTEKKLLLICAKGYSLQDNDIRGLSAEKAKKYLLRYILSLKGKTKAEKAEIAELCGFEVVNGRIITKNL